MNSNKIKGFFYPGNAVSGEPDYEIAEVFVRSAEAFANTIYRMYLFISFLILSCSSISAVNIVTYTTSDSLKTSSDKLEMQFRHLSNDDNKVRISFDLKSDNIPFTIFYAEWINGDSIYTPIDQFSLVAHDKEVAGKSTEWHITLDFPFSETFEESDALILHTNKGIVRCPTSRAGELKETIDLLRNEFENKLDSSKKKSRDAWLILTFTLTIIVVIGCSILVMVRQRFIRKRKEIEELSMLISERTNRNLELEAKVDALYGSRLDTLNMLCNEYFEKNDSDKMKQTLYNEVEKHILALRNKKSIEELEMVVNTYLDNILVKVKKQLPELTHNDIILLTYLYAGFSPRAVCIFTDIKIKNFYNRRSRLKDRILASDAPDKEYFVSKM